MIEQPFILISAPNGARINKTDHAAVPLTVSELSDTAERLVELGVSVLHLHVRDHDGQHSLDVDHYLAAMADIEDRIGDQLIIQITTEAVGRYDRHQQMALVRALKPEAVSLALRELCPEDHHVPEASDFFREVLEQGTWPQYILYSAADVKRFNHLRKQNVFGEKQPFALFVLGSYHDKQPGNPLALDGYLEYCGNSFPWSVCCFGETEANAIARAYSLGGHGRIGFENNRLLADGRTADDNYQLIAETLANLTDETVKRPLATAAWIRQSLMRVS